MVKKIWDNLRSSFDTLYLGFRTDSDDGYEVLEEIKNYLSSLCFISLDEGKGNAYYWGSFCNKENGVYLFVEPRKGLLNDFITLQLSGKFFHDIWASRNFIEVIFDKYQDMIIFQRIDVAVDVMFKQFPIVKPHDGFLSGFPVPSYSDNYKYCKQGFEVYGRASSNPNVMYFHNMVAQGKGDVRLRVYDKTLDNLEKEKMNYSEVYMFETYYEQVYRIELQARGAYLKGYIDKYYKKYENLDYVTLLESLICYMFKKYSFEFVELSDIVSEIRHPLSFSKLKKESTLINQWEHNRAIQNKAYHRCVEIADKLQAHREVAKAISGLSKEEIKNIIVDFDMYACIKEYQDLNKEFLK